MATEAEDEVKGLALLRQPATEALVRFLEDLRSTIGFQAYLWRLIVKVDYRAKLLMIKEFLPHNDYTRGDWKKWVR